MQDAPDARTTLTVRAITARETLPLRMSQLRQGYPEADSIFAGDDDPLTLHAGAWLGEQLVSIASIYRESRAVDAPGGAPLAADHAAGTAWRLRGMATLPEARRRGAGAAALAACLAHVVEQDGTLAWCNARTGAVAFYEAAGWQVVSEQFELPTIGPHMVMERRLRPA